MTPGPSREELIATIRNDAASADPIAQLATASQTVAELEEVIDAALAHFVEQCRTSGRSWSEISKALGVTKQAAHKRFSTVTTTLERFTQRARRLLPGAVSEAQELGHIYVGTEHILLALIADADCLAANVLTDLNITRAAIEHDLLAVTPRGEAKVDAPPFTPRSRVHRELGKRGTPTRPQLCGHRAHLACVVRRFVEPRLRDAHAARCDPR